MINTMGLTTTIYLFATLLGLTANLVSSGAVNQQDAGMASSAADLPGLSVISDEDSNTMEHIKHNIKKDFADFKEINDVHVFLDKVKLLVQKHPKNVALAQGDLKELDKFLSSEMVTKLIRVDTEPFIMPIADDKLPYAQRAIDDDELTRKLFNGPLTSYIESKKPVHPDPPGNPKDNNFFVNFWCKISGCSN